MPKTRFVFSIAVAALLVATPAMGQLNNFPVLALPGGGADGANSVGAGWGRGLNDTSGKNNSFGAGVIIAREMVSFAVNGAYVADVGAANDSEITFGGTVAYNLPQAVNTSSVSFGIQGGIEWMSPATGTLLNFPIGLSARGSTTAGSLEIPLWIMPRWQWTRLSPDTGDSSTDNNFGLSGGLSGVTEGGLGLGLSVDWSRVDRGGTAKVNKWLFGAAVFYRLP